MPQQGQLNVQTENVLPIIKKFLYSDEEIFLRELISNAVDATQKLKVLVDKGQYTQEIGTPKVTVRINKEQKTLTISDQGVGMTAEEVDKYINQIAFSSAEEFLKKYEQSEGTTDGKPSIIGHFGLGFYSAFMVAHRVEIESLSYQEGATPVHWSATGDTQYTIDEGSRSERGTDVVLHLNPENEEFLEATRVEHLLKKYCGYMPVPIYLDNQQINKTDPIWAKSPSEITEEEYNQLYRELYPASPDPLFHIHLNVDYPFTLTGILYFPKISGAVEVQQNKIQLYSNQVYVTDNVSDIVPEFLTLLHGVIDSPDIPLNVSRSYLQADSQVKKISGYIVRKVADKLQELFKKDREDFAAKWDDIGIFIKYGMLTDDKFREKAKNFTLVKNTQGEAFTPEEYKEKVKPVQTDKNDNIVWLYANDVDAQHTYIDAAQRRGYDVLKFVEAIDSHYVQLLESEVEGVQIKRVDADSIDNLISKEGRLESPLTQAEEDQLKEHFNQMLPDDNFQVQIEPMESDDMPVVITREEFQRRMEEMSRLGGINLGAELPTTYQVKVNANHPLQRRILLQTDENTRQKMMKQALDLAKLSHGTLKGKELSNFISRSVEMLKS